MTVNNKHTTCCMLLAALISLTLANIGRAARPGRSPVKVFILAGQSNMEGQGIVPSDPKRNGGKGTLEYLVKNPATSGAFSHLVDNQGNWLERQDVWIWYLGRKGPLTVGYGAGPDRIGPELQFGHVMADHFENQVLLIKAAWGGKSLAKDFRPPSSAGQVGPYYTEMLKHVRDVLANLKKHFPDYDGRGYEITGIGWHQGWNDRVNQAFNDEYEKNLANFIRDIRKESDAAGLPFVIAETGMSGHAEKHPRALSLMRAQAAVAEYDEFKDNVAFVGTKDFYRPKEASPSGQAYHWNTNAETYFLIGNAMGLAMKKLCSRQQPAGMPRFEYHEIARTGQRMGQTSLVDIDRDGDLDWVVGQAGKMWWFEYIGPDKWIQHDMGEGARTDVGGCAFDIDGDGWIDQVSGTAWYRNTAKPRTEIFERYDNGAISCHDNVAADIDGDGKLDVVACSNDKRHVITAWYKIGPNVREKWTEHKIGKGIHGGVGPKGVADLDNDGDNDVVRGDVWFENVDGKGLQWKEHAVLTPPGGSRPDRFGLALKVWTCDLDDDGDSDIVIAEADCTDARVLWFENIDNAESWRCRLISAEHTRQDFHSLAVADFDNDGDLDVFSGGGPLSQSRHECFIWENLDAEGRQWKQHLILAGRRCHEAKAADVDRDGDIDICSKPWAGDLHFYLRNMLVEDAASSR
ncbi:MAG: VCBS repeat-containing protein [Phycisphaerales bacterium]|nr:MAG: VCBS repeat-containing protein [Phycisphaerales bacterium]